MGKEKQLELLKLLSAIESFMFSTGAKVPDYLSDRLAEAISELTKEVLK